MIDFFENTARVYPDRVFFTFVSAGGTEISYTYRQTRLAAAALARRLQSMGVNQGDAVIVDLPNNTAFVLLSLAAAYGSFSLVTLNHRLSSAEKLSRMLELEREGVRVACTIDEAYATNMLGGMNTVLHDEYSFLDAIYQDMPRTRVIMGSRQDIIDDTIHFAEREAHLFDSDSRAVIMFTSGTTGKPKAVPLSWRQLIASAEISNKALSAPGEGLWQAVLPFYHIGGFQVIVRSVVNGTPLRVYERFDAERVLRDAETRRVTHISVVDKMLQDLLSADECYVEQQIAEARQSSSATGSGLQQGADVEAGGASGGSGGGAGAGSGAQQGGAGEDSLASQNAEGTIDGAVAAGGIDSAAGTKAAVAASSIDAAGGTKAATAAGGTKAAAGVSRQEPFPARRLTLYRCILLGGGAINPQTVDRVIESGARVYASYGMTETSSQIAHELITPNFVGGLKILDGYEVHIVEPDEDGFGDLAVRGPSIFDGYLNARAAFTVDGFFLTGDEAALHDGQLYVQERTTDMFVSGGENVYPAEIEHTIRKVSGVSDAYVFGVADKTWGRRPVAIVERAQTTLRAQEVRRLIERRLSKLTVPDDILMVDKLPRTGIGKIDRRATEKLYENRLDIAQIVLYQVRLPFKTPFKTAQKTLKNRDLVIVEVIDHAGRIGLGECVAFRDDWYLPETLGDDIPFIRNELAPILLDQVFLHPREVSPVLSKVPGAEKLPMAQSALEVALWDLYGRIQDRPLWALINEEYERMWGINSLRSTGVISRPEAPRATTIKGTQALVYAGAVVGAEEPANTVREVADAVSSGYRRVKLKIMPYQGLAATRAVREAFPDLLVTLDANRSFVIDDIEELRAFDDLGVGWIEEPLAVTSRKGLEGSTDPLVRMARLQHSLATPLCVDESFTNAAEADRILKLNNLRCIAVKISKFGGIERALRFIMRAHGKGREVWMGGMYDTGISRRVHAAFETLPGVVIPGDIGATSRYFKVDVTTPAYTTKHGCVLLNGDGHRGGIGCDLNEEELKRVLVRREVIEAT